MQGESEGGQTSAADPCTPRRQSDNSAEGVHLGEERRTFVKTVARFLFRSALRRRKRRRGETLYSAAPARATSEWNRLAGASADVVRGTTLAACWLGDDNPPQRVCPRARVCDFKNAYRFQPRSVFFFFNFLAFLKFPVTLSTQTKIEADNANVLRLHTCFSFNRDLIFICRILRTPCLYVAFVAMKSPERENKKRHKRPSLRFLSCVAGALPATVPRWQDAKR